MSRFGSLLKQGIRTVAARQDKRIGIVQQEIAVETGFSEATVDYWCLGNIPSVQSCVEKLVRYCVEYGLLERQWARSMLTQAQHPTRSQLLQELFPESKPYVFLCYDRSSQADLDVALRVAQGLALDEIPVFFDSGQRVTESWSKLIEEELSKADLVIAFLSQTAVAGEVAPWELETIGELARQRLNQPRLLIVRLNYRASYPGSLAELLSDVEWTFWRNASDTPRLLEELRKAAFGRPLPVDRQLRDAFISEPSSPQPPLLQAQVKPASGRFEMLQGTMDPDSDFYIVRRSDAIAIDSVYGQGATITIKGARQVGKSSLLVRIAQEAKQLAQHVVYVDFQLLRASIDDPERFYRQFCALVGRGLGLSDQTDAHWQELLPNPMRCTDYFRDYLLPSVDGPVLLAMDEADSLFATDFRSDFFGMLRAWHNQRALEPIWKRLTLALVTSTEPYSFIDNLNESPFNVGEVLSLEDFSADQCAQLNRRYGSPLLPDEELRLMALLHGHPYLTQRALYLVASARISTAELFAQAGDDNGPFGDHLRSLVLRIGARPALLAALRQVYQEGSCLDQQLLFRLRGAGLVHEEGRRLLPRCQLYADFLKDRFDD